MVKLILVHRFSCIKRNLASGHTVLLCCQKKTLFSLKEKVFRFVREVFAYDLHWPRCKSCHWYLPAAPIQCLPSALWRKSSGERVCVVRMVQNRTRHIWPTFDAWAVEVERGAEGNLWDAIEPVCDDAMLPSSGHDHSINWLTVVLWPPRISTTQWKSTAREDWCEIRNSIFSWNSHPSIYYTTLFFSLESQGFPGFSSSYHWANAGWHPGQIAGHCRVK